MNQLQLLSVLHKNGSGEQVFLPLKKNKLQWEF